ncbi:helix-turn-helix domain-containing protein [Arthrobacter sp. R4]|uniref:helix-turn-helix domain-containing protein n=1 Tax=Arthrobacter sp. R4 TaxID=644417 RepID=UPI003EDAEAE1
MGHWGPYEAGCAYDNHMHPKGPYTMPVPTGKQPSPSPLARAFSSRVRIAMADQRVTAQALAKSVGVSRSYLGKRLRDEVSFTLNEVESISRILGLELPEF